MKAARRRKHEEQEEEENEEVYEKCPTKRTRSDAKGEKGTDLWKVTDSTPSLFVLDTDTEPSDKIASFDMDGTLIATKSGNKFSTGRTDWKWWHPKVPTKLKELHKSGYKLVIFSNQGGVGKGKVSAKDIKGKVEDIIAELGLPMMAFLATGEDKWRKPSASMWDHFVKHHNGGVKVDTKDSFYCGDAAGRPKAWDGNAKTKKDFSCSDRKFAHNVGLPFKTPEMCFLGQQDVAFEWGSIDPTTIPKDKTAYEGDLASDSQEMIISVGFPASGKSTFTKRHLEPKGYVRINQDSLKTKSACFKAARAAVAEGKSVVIDNTNPSAAARAEYIAIAKEHNIPVRCFFFRTSRDLAEHLNVFRENVYGVKHVPGVGYNMYKKHFKEPSLDEGFAEIKDIKFVPQFDDPEKEQLFYHFT
jgi:bifunctional polynucleotide phosphatase/kinase